MYVGSGQQGAQAVIQDSGPAGGGGVGVGFSEWLQVTRGTGTGPNGAHNCAYDNPITNSSGYHYLCFDADLLGGGLIEYGYGGGASALPFSFNVNGYPITLPTVPGATWATFTGSVTNGDALCAENVGGSLTIKDCGAVPGTGTVTQVATGNGLSGGPITTSGTIIPTDTQRPITSAYTIGQSSNNDCGIHIVASGGTFYAISANAASTYSCGSGNFFVEITNNDPMPTGSNSTGAKFVNFVSCTSTAGSGTYLWPGQTLRAAVINNAWVPVRCPGPWEMPSGTFTLNVDPTYGSDTYGATDGLGLTTRAFGNIDVALYLAAEVMKNSSFTQTQLNIKLCSGCADAAGVHWALHANMPGAQGGAGVIVDCNGGSEGGAVEEYFHTVLAFQNCTFTNVIQLQSGAIFVLNNGNTVVPVSGALNFIISTGSSIYNNATSLTVAGGSGAGLIVLTGAQVSLPPINQTGDITWSTAGVFVLGAGYLQMSTWNTNAYTVTGTKYNLSECGIAEGTNNLPGTVSGIYSCTQAN